MLWQYVFTFGNNLIYSTTDRTGLNNTLSTAQTEGGCTGGSSHLCQHLPSLPRKTGNGPGPLSFFLLCAFFFFLAFAFAFAFAFVPYTVPALLSHISNFVNPCLFEGPLQSPSFSSCLLNAQLHLCIPIFPSVEASSALGRAPSQGKRIGDGRGNGCRSYTGAWSERGTLAEVTYSSPMLAALSMAS